MPRGALLAVGGLLLLTLLAVAGVRWSGLTPQSESQAAVVAERRLQFSDRPDGRIEVREHGRLLTVLPPGEHGFLRGTLRALARERRLATAPGPEPHTALTAGGEPPPAFRLRARADGRLSLDDPQTGRRIDLESFGASNAASFAALLRLPPTPGP